MVTGVDGNGNFVTEAIENIEVGDVVLATDEFNPEAPPEYKLVTGVSSRTVEGLKEVTYNVDGNVETIQTTENHEFFVVGIGWLLASELTSAHVLRLADGSEVAVTSVTDLVGSATVHNLTVTDGATYFVDDGSGVVDAVVVHNARIPRLGKKIVPNPYGKLGGPKHRAKVAQVVRNIESRGLEVRTELRVKTIGGKKATRDMDVVAIDPKTKKIVEVHQVGRTLKSKAKVPVSRERYALRDVRLSVELRGAKRFFHKY